MKSLNVKLTFTEPILGTASADPEIHRRFIASKAPDALTREEEVAVLGVDEVTERSVTVFPRDEDDNPFLFDYQVRGFFKDACGMLRRVDGMKSKKLTAYKKVVDGLIFVNPRRIRLELPEGACVEECQRPLRAETAQGPRVAIAHSEQCPAGTTVEFEIQILQDNLEGVVKEWLEYGKLRGIGQWRNSGMGRFTYEVIE